jgi:hypothetical protein
VFNLAPANFNAAGNKEEKGWETKNLACGLNTLVLPPPPILPRHFVKMSWKNRGRFFEQQLVSARSVRINLIGIRHGGIRAIRIRVNFAPIPDGTPRVADLVGIIVNVGVSAIILIGIVALVVEIIIEDPFEPTHSYCLLGFNKFLDREYKKPCGLARLELLAKN